MTETKKKYFTFNTFMKCGINNNNNTNDNIEFHKYSHFYPQFILHFSNDIVYNF